MSTFQMKQGKLENYQHIFFEEELNLICPPKLQVPKFIRYEAM